MDGVYLLFKPIISPKHLLTWGGCLALVLCLPVAAQARPTCDRFASPTGVDTHAGTIASPYRSVNKLSDALAPGETGCLRSGIYGNQLTVRNGGASENRRITIRSYPGERATILGRIVITKSAPFFTLQNLILNGRNSARLPSPTVNARRTTLRRNDITNNNTAICVLLGAFGGNLQYGRALRPLVEFNRIHHCGILPAGNHDHGIYAEGSVGAIIRGNWIYRNADRGIQLYPNAQRSRVYGNVLDGNGQNMIFGGIGASASDNNLVRNNVFSFSRLRHNVESYYGGGRPGRGNVVRANCLRSGVRDDQRNGGIDSSQGGFRHYSNRRVANPLFRNRARFDYRLRVASPCRNLLGSWASRMPGFVLGRR